jgi:hypothetical protein
MVARPQAPALTVVNFQCFCLSELRPHDGDGAEILRRKASGRRNCNWRQKLTLVIELASVAELGCLVTVSA